MNVRHKKALYAFHLRPPINIYAFLPVFLLLMLSELCFGLGIASAIILAHNHPSGQLKLSDADLKLTQKLKEGGKYLEIPVLDHIIVTSEGCYAFADEGVL
jgi:hypothetical protein